MNREQNARRFIKGNQNSQKTYYNSRKSLTPNKDPVNPPRSKSNKKKETKRSKSKKTNPTTKYKTPNSNSRRNNSYTKKYAMQNSNRNIKPNRLKSSKNSERSVKTRKPKKSSTKEKSRPKNSNSNQIRNINNKNNRNKQANTKKGVNTNVNLQKDINNKFKNVNHLSHISEETNEVQTFLESRNDKISNVFKISTTNSFVPVQDPQISNINLISKMNIPQSPKDSNKIIRSQSLANKKRVSINPIAKSDVNQLALLPIVNSNKNKIGNDQKKKLDILVEKNHFYTDKEEEDELGRLYTGLKRLGNPSSKKILHSYLAKSIQHSQPHAIVKPLSQSLTSLNKNKIPGNNNTEALIPKIAEEPEELDSPPTSVCEKNNQTSVTTLRKDTHNMQLNNFIVTGKSTDSLNLENIKNNSLKPQEENQVNFIESQQITIDASSQPNNFIQSEQFETSNLVPNRINSMQNSYNLHSQFTDIKPGESRIKSSINPEFNNVINGTWEGTDTTIMDHLQNFNGQSVSTFKKDNKLIPNSELDKLIEEQDRQWYLEEKNQNLESLLNNNQNQNFQFEFSGKIQKENMDGMNDLLSNFEKTNQTFNLPQHDLLSVGNNTLNNTNKTELNHLLSEVNSKISNNFQYSINLKKNSQLSGSNIARSLNNRFDLYPNENNINKKQSTIQEVDENGYITNYESENKTYKTLNNNNNVTVSQSISNMNNNLTVRDTHLLDKTDPMANSKNVLSYDMGDMTLINKSSEPNENTLKEDKNYNDIINTIYDNSKLDISKNNKQQMSLIDHLSNNNNLQHDIVYDINDNENNNVNTTIMSAFESNLDSKLMNNLQMNRNKTKNYFDSEISGYQVNTDNSFSNINDNSTFLSKINNNLNFDTNHMPGTSGIRSFDPQASEMMVKFSGIDSFVDAGKNEMNHDNNINYDEYRNETEEYDTEENNNAVENVNSEENEEEYDTENDEYEYSDNENNMKNNTFEDSQYKFDRDELENEENLEDGPDLDKIECNTKIKKKVYNLTDSSINEGSNNPGLPNISAMDNSIMQNTTIMDNSKVINNKVINDRDESSFYFDNNFNGKKLMQNALLSTNSATPDNLLGIQNTFLDKHSKGINLLYFICN